MENVKKEKLNEVQLNDVVGGINTGYTNNNLRRAVCICGWSSGWCSGEEARLYADAHNKLCHSVVEITDQNNGPRSF